MLKSALKRMELWAKGQFRDPPPPSQPVVTPPEAKREDPRYLHVPVVPVSGQPILPGGVQLLHIPEARLRQTLQGYSRQKHLVLVAGSQSLHLKEGTKQIAVLSEIVEIDRQVMTDTVAAQGHSRVLVLNLNSEILSNDAPLSIATVQPIPDIWGGRTISKEEAKVRLLELMNRWLFLKGNYHPDLLASASVLPADRLCDMFAFYAIQDSTQKKKTLELIDGEERYRLVEGILTREIDDMERFPSIYHFPTDHHAIH